MKKAFAILMALCLMATQFLVCYAENVPEIQPFYTDAKKVEAILAISSSGVATCKGRVMPKAGATKCIGSMQVIINGLIR